MKNIIPEAVKTSSTPERVRPVQHVGACGERIPCPRHGLLAGLYRPAERLINGTVIAHDCGKTWRPTELPPRVPA